MRVGAFATLREADLLNTRKLVEWFDRESKSSNPIVERTGASLRNVIASAIRSVDVVARDGGNGVALFAWTVSKKRWDVLSSFDEDRAHLRLKQFQASGGVIHPSLGGWSQHAEGDAMDSMYAFQRGAFASITTGSLKSTRWLIDWHTQECRAEVPAVPLGESGLLACLAAAEHALDCGRNPAAFFVRIVSRKMFGIIRKPSWKRAERRLRECRGELASSRN